MTVTATRRARTQRRLEAKANKAVPEQVKPQRARRTSDQQIADLEKKIEQVKRRAQEQKVKKDPALRHVSGALRAIDKALASSEDKATRSALSEARSGMAAVLALTGVLQPKGSGRTAGTSGTRIAPDVVLDYVQAHPGAQSEDIAAALGTGSAGIRPALVQLKADGKVTVHGKDRATRYSAS
jgi:hypothetical protein